MILDIVVLILLSYVAFFKEYLKKKGSNLADKEDIAEITKQIERVKKVFSEENEFLKANLQFVINNQLQHSNESRNAIINFYDIYSQWLFHGLLDLRFNEYTRSNIDDLILKDRTLNEYYYKSNVAQSRISLLVENYDINTVSNQLVTDTLKFNHWAMRLLLKLRQKLESLKRDNELFMTLLEIKPLPVEASYIADREKLLNAEIKEVCNLFYKELGEEYAKLFPVLNEFKTAVRTHFNKPAPVSV